MKLNVIKTIQTRTGKSLWVLQDETKKELTAFADKWNASWQVNQWIEVDPSQVTQNGQYWNVKAPGAAKKSSMNDDALRLINQKLDIILVTQNTIHQLLKGQIAGAAKPTTPPVVAPTAENSLTDADFKF